jgi:hypothetical protein
MVLGGIPVSNDNKGIVSRIAGSGDYWMLYRYTDQVLVLGYNTSKAVVLRLMTAGCERYKGHAARDTECTPAVVHTLNKRIRSADDPFASVSSLIITVDSTATADSGYILSTLVPILPKGNAFGAYIHFCSS